MPLRLIARAAPLFFGVFAAAIWLRRREPERPALPAAPAPRSTRFVRGAESREVDIVTVVDDLLDLPR